VEAFEQVKDVEVGRMNVGEGPIFFAHPGTQLVTPVKQAHTGWNTLLAYASSQILSTSPNSSSEVFMIGRQKFGGHIYWESNLSIMSTSSRMRTGLLM
jgi:hypothetical protein